MISEQELAQELKKAKLIFISDQRPGLMRQKIGLGFCYYNSQGEKVNSQKILGRIQSLSVPPAWQNVWICPSPLGYLQATGYDEKGRKQYLYHQAWIHLCQQNKFDKLLFFGQALSKIRKNVKKDMQLNGLQKKKVVATVVWLLEHTLIRIGNEEYVKENNSFGLTTLRNRHVNIRGDKVMFHFVGKSGIEHDVDVTHPEVAKIIKECIELPGYELFKYLDKEGTKHSIDSADVNSYLKVITGDEITAKDFRTWGATLLSAVTLHQFGIAADKKEAQEKIKQAIKVVANHLQNTIAVCRDYYIHPIIYKCYLNGSLEQIFLEHDKNVPKNLSPQEYKVICLLKNNSEF